MLILCNMESHPALPFLKMLCASQKQAVHCLRPEEMQTPLGTIAFEGMASRLNAVSPFKGSPLTTISSPQSFSEPMIVFAGVDQETVSSMIDRMNAMQLPKIPMKAVLTPTNAAWTAPILYQALQEEVRGLSRH